MRARIPMILYSTKVLAKRVLKFGTWEMFTAADAAIVPLDVENVRVNWGRSRPTTRDTDAAAESLLPPDVNVGICPRVRIAASLPTVLAFFPFFFLPIAVGDSFLSPCLL